MKHIQRHQFSFTKTSIKVSLKILVLICFKPASRCLLFSKMNSRQENRSKLSFTARIITTCRSPSWAPATCKYSLELLLSICGEIKSKGFLKFYKLIIKPDSRSDHYLILNLTNVHKPNSRINYARLH